MNIQLGTLQLVPALERPDLLAKSVADFLQGFARAGEIGVAEIDPSLSDTAVFCEFYKVGMEQAANCVIVEGKRAENTWLAACVILGSTRADVNGMVRRTLDARKVSFAPMEKAVVESHMEFGAITPVGLPDTWPILVDTAVADSDYVIIGSGVRGSKLAVPGSIFSSLPSVQILEGLAQVKNV